MKTIKNKLFLATAILALASCADNTYLGDEEITKPDNRGVISFGSSTPSLTRAERTGATAAGDLGYKFKVYATKTVSSVTSNVFASGAYPTSDIANYDADLVAYWVWYNATTAGTTTSNTSNWEYVGAAGTHGTTDHLATLTYDQSIKYWDNNADKYEFVAYSATVSGATISKYQTSGFTVAATPTQLAGLYIADKKEILKNTPEFAHEVKFTFRRAATKVRLGIYETVPGYKVKDVKFHYNTNQNSTTNAILDGKFVGNSSESKTFNVTYDATTKKAQIEPSEPASTNTTYYDFGTFTSNGENYLGETSTSPTWANANVSDHYIAVFPNTVSTNVDNMTLTIDYTLINTVSGETIDITGATATVPAAYMTWNPNFAYTYLFKITDNKLTPITFDAVTIDDGEGNQQTITTVDNPSITTYQKGAIVNEYNAGNIYVVVGEGTALTVGTNAKLYTAEAADGYAGGITEASVVNALENGTEDNSGTPTTWTVTDANSKTLVVSSASGLTAFSSIPAGDSPTGVALTVNGAYFNASAGTNYVFEYIKVATYKAATGTYVEGTTYYTDNTGATEVDTSSFTAETNVSSYFVVDDPEEKHYKVIKVQ